jgi:prepilin-type processing-associated H-X9-DG protein
MYAQDYDEWFPPAYNSFGTAGQSRYWADFLAPYVGVKGKYDKNASPCYANTIFDCSSLESQLIVPTDYLYFRVLWAYWSGGTNEWAQYNDMTRIMKPSEVGVVADSEGSEWGNPTSNAGIGVLGEKVSSQRLRNRHSEGLNILYCDGHVKWQRASIGDNLANIFDESKHR